MQSETSLVMKQSVYQVCQSVYDLDGISVLVIRTLLIHINQVAVMLKQ